MASIHERSCCLQKTRLQVAYIRFRRLAPNGALLLDPWWKNLPEMCRLVMYSYGHEERSRKNNRFKHVFTNITGGKARSVLHRMLQTQVESCFWQSGEYWHRNVNDDEATPTSWKADCKRITVKRSRTQGFCKKTNP